MVSELVRTGPSMNRGKSKQDYGTPREFIDAVERRFGRIDFDLAASAENSVCDDFFYDEARNSLEQDWGGHDGRLWLNPPFANIEPWAAKCAEQWERGAFLFLLTPASVGAQWFQRHCLTRGFALWLSPRLKFVGADDPYPKDLALTIFGFGMVGSAAWRWK